MSIKKFPAIFNAKIAEKVINILSLVIIYNVAFTVFMSPALRELSMALLGHLESCFTAVGHYFSTWSSHAEPMRTRALVRPRFASGGKLSTSRLECARLMRFINDGLVKTCRPLKLGNMFWNKKCRSKLIEAKRFILELFSRRRHGLPDCSSIQQKAKLLC